MKRTFLLLLSTLLLTGCYKENIYEPAAAPGNSSGNHSGGGAGSNSGNGSTSHECGYPTKNGTPCKRKVSGATGYCWQHK